MDSKKFQTQNTEASTIKKKEISKKEINRKKINLTESNEDLSIPAPKQPKNKSKRDIKKQLTVNNVPEQNHMGMNVLKVSKIQSEPVAKVDKIKYVKRTDRSISALEDNVILDKSHQVHHDTINLLFSEKNNVNPALLAQKANLDKFYSSSKNKQHSHNLKIHSNYTNMLKAAFTSGNLINQKKDSDSAINDDIFSSSLKGKQSLKRIFSLEDNTPHMTDINPQLRSLKTEGLFHEKLDETQEKKSELNISRQLNNDKSNSLMNSVKLDNGGDSTNRKISSDFKKTGIQSTRIKYKNEFINKMRKNPYFPNEKEPKGDFDKKVKSLVKESKITISESLSKCINLMDIQMQADTLFLKNFDMHIYFRFFVYLKHMNSFPES